MSTYVAVMGPGRCGSSMVAGMLHQAGVKMGVDLIGAHPINNPMGHFEDYEYHRLHREMIYTMDHDACLTDETLRQYRFDLEPRKIGAIMDDYARRIEDHNNGGMWGAKCIFLGAAWPWMQHLLPAQRRIIVVHRQWSSIIDSRIRHAGISREVAEAMTAWLQGRIFQTVSRANCPVLHVQYEEVLQVPYKHARRMCQFVGGDLDMDRAAVFVSPQLNHHGMVPA